MKYIVTTVLAVISSLPAVAKPPIEVEIVGTPADYQVLWTSRPGYLYRIESSPDLESWQDAGIEFPGTGLLLGHGFQAPGDDRWFHRVSEGPDAENSGFLTLPLPGEELGIEDGVPFAFDLGLDVLPQFPARIRIYQRVYDSGAPWNLIGAVDNSMDVSLDYFTEIRSVRFARGSVVWLPTAAGDYEVRATAVDANGQVLANATRMISVIANRPPTVAIVTGPATPAVDQQLAEFTTTVSDPDGDEIGRVEFYDDGLLMGTDVEAPFGDIIIDRMGNLVEYLWQGTHPITAKAYGSNGAPGVLSEPFMVTITGGNSQPQVEIWYTYQYNGWLSIHYGATDPEGESHLVKIKAMDLETGDSAEDNSAPFNVVYLDIAGLAPGIHTMAVNATDDVGAASYPVFVDVVIPGTPPPPPGGTPFAAALAAEIADEATVTITNARFTGDEDSSDLFEEGLPRGLELNHGVILTTGLAILWNTGDTSEIAEGRMGSPGDEELFKYVEGAATLDAAVLEFDAFCVNGQLVIDYQFGSEEYDEYVVEGFNDAFVVIVDGVPVSLIPDGTDIVGVQSISLVKNRHLFLGDLEDIVANAMVDPAYESTKVEYDGLTRRLRANALVTPGQIHHVRIVIADVNDDKRDSALFLGRASLKTIQPQP